jgi:hypothetical protein
VTAQLVGHRDHVDGARRGVDRTDGVEHVLVGRTVEVTDPEPRLTDDADRVTRQQQRTEDRFLGLKVVGRDTPDRTRGVAASFVPVSADELLTSHGEPTLSGLSCAREGEQPWVLPVERLWTTSRICG